MLVDFASAVVPGLLTSFFVAVVAVVGVLGGMHALRAGVSQRVAVTGGRRPSTTDAWKHDPDKEIPCEESWSIFCRDMTEAKISNEGEEKGDEEMLSVLAFWRATDTDFTPWECSEIVRMFQTKEAREKARNLLLGNGREPQSDGP